MDLKKAYGVETTLGRALAQHSLEDGLKRVESADEFRKFIETVPTPLPREVLTQWAQRIADAEWTKARAKLLLGAQLAKGKVRELSEDEAARQNVGHRR